MLRYNWTDHVVAVHGAQSCRYRTRFTHNTFTRTAVALDWSQLTGRLNSMHRSLQQRWTEKHLRTCNTSNLERRRMGYNSKWLSGSTPEQELAWDSEHVSMDPTWLQQLRLVVVMGGGGGSEFSVLHQPPWTPGLDPVDQEVFGGCKILCTTTQLTSLQYLCDTVTPTRARISKERFPTPRGIHAMNYGVPTQY